MSHSQTCRSETKIGSKFDLPRLWRQAEPPAMLRRLAGIRNDCSLACKSLATLGAESPSFARCVRNPLATKRNGGSDVCAAIGFGTDLPSRAALRSNSMICRLSAAISCRWPCVALRSATVAARISRRAKRAISCLSDCAKFAMTLPCWRS